MLVSVLKDRSATVVVDEKVTTTRVANSAFPSLLSSLLRLFAYTRDCLPVPDGEAFGTR